MEVEDALKAMACIDEQNDGTEARAAAVADLHAKLLEDPEGFWDYFFELQSTLRGDDPLHDLAERLIREGKTSFSDARAALESHYAVTPKQQ